MFVGDRNPTSTTVHHCFNPAFGHARTQPRKNAHPGSSSFQSG
ncbi:hypothetical protein HanPSC8_Chr07g0304451 [Helianthus annuus]|nr:hypothetical protein HanPSC8_Chr07g0304451 [Helianthus annuus]